MYKVCNAVIKNKGIQTKEKSYKHEFLSTQFQCVCVGRSRILLEIFKYSYQTQLKKI